MRLVFAGTPDFAVPALDALHAAGHDIAAVYTQPDRPAGRGRKVRPSAVAQRALALGLPLRQPARFTTDEVDALHALAADVMVVVAYGLILPQAVLDAPRLGCVNIHASLLPRWRGAAPIARAILAGDRETGVTIMQMDAGLDTGPMLISGRVPIADDATAEDLHDRLATLGAQLVVTALRELDQGRLAALPQPADGATYAPKLTKAEARLDWNRPATELARAVRAYNPVPVAWTELDGERVRVHAAAAVDGDGDGDEHTPPGSVLQVAPDGVTVATGAGHLRITRLQRPGGRALDAAAAVRGWPLDGRRFT